MPPRLLVALLTVLALSAMDSAAARVGELQVRAGARGEPCFTISEAEELRSGAPDFHAITVSAGKATLWTMVMPSDRTFPVSFRMCIPYAGRLPVLPQRPAAELQAGRVYEVVIEARGRASAAMPRSYRGRFCLARDKSGALALRQVVRLSCADRPN